MPPPPPAHAPLPAEPMFVKAEPSHHELPADLEGMAAPHRPAAVREAPAARVVGLARRNPRVAAGAGLVAVIAIGVLLLSSAAQPQARSPQARARRLRPSPLCCPRPATRRWC